MSDYAGKTAITFGVFDLLHFGHFELFRRIRELVGENGKVYVMLQIDEMIAKYKPGCKSVYDFTTRQKMIESLRTVDKAIPYDVVGVDAVKDICFDSFFYFFENCTINIFRSKTNKRLNTKTIEK